jgi:hypothetical protein
MTIQSPTTAIHSHYSMHFDSFHFGKSVETSSRVWLILQSPRNDVGWNGPESGKDGET